jgi:PPM family protein phosphatase
MMNESKKHWRSVVSQPVDLTDFHPLSSALAVEVAAASVCGRLRPHNTDHYLAIRFGRLQETIVTSLAAADLPPRFEEYAYAMLVADGLDESGAGVRASRVALSTLAKLAIRYGRWNVRADPETLAEIVEQGEFFYRRASDEVLRASRADLALTDMATSLTALYIAESDLIFAHVGHSKAFLFRTGSLTQLTKDHTLEHPQFRRPGARPAERPKADYRHFVTRSVGGDPAGPDVEIEHIKLSVGDRLLLCTNGLTDVVGWDQIADTLALQRPPRDDCQQLIDLARAEGSPDDVTVMVADYRLRSDSPVTHRPTPLATG